MVDHCYRAKHHDNGKVPLVSSDLESHGAWGGGRSNVQLVQPAPRVHHERVTLPLAETLEGEAVQSHIGHSPHTQQSLQATPSHIVKGGLCVWCQPIQAWPCIICTHTQGRPFFTENGA